MDFDNYVFSLSAIFCALIFIQYIRYKKCDDVLSVLNGLFFFSLFDVAIPAVLIYVYGWYPSVMTSVEALSSALLYYAVFIVLFVFGYLTASKVIYTRATAINRNPPAYVNFAAVPGVCFLAFIYIIGLINGILKFDHFYSWLINSCNRSAYGSRPIYESWIDQLLSQLALPAFSAIISLLGAYYICCSRREQLVLYVLIPCAFILSISTFSRATIAICIICLGYAYYIKKGEMTLRFLAILLFAAVISFFAYGSVRNYCASYTQQSIQPAQQAENQPGYSTQPHSQQSISKPATSALLFEMQRFIRGEGLIGLANILTFYNIDNKLNGKTYKDSLLLIVPRFIYKEKPSWYGAADITRPMNGQMSQDAVTIVGESYANYGLFGILICFFWGVIFRALEIIAEQPGFEMLLPSALLPALITSMWMGSIGLMNSMVIFIFTYGCLKFSFKKINYSK